MQQIETFGHACEPDITELPISQMVANWFDNGQIGWCGLIITGGDSHSRGFRFESQHQKQHGNFSYYIVVKIVMYVVKRPKKRKMAQEWPI